MNYSDEVLITLLEEALYAITSAEAAQPHWSEKRRRLREKAKRLCEQLKQLKA